MGERIPLDSNLVAPERIAHRVASALMDFGSALKALRDRNQVSREGWSGETWIALVSGADWWLYADSRDSEELSDIINSSELASFILLKTPKGRLIPWVATQSDLLATDWGIVSPY